MASVTAAYYLQLEGLAGASKHVLHMGEFELLSVKFAPQPVAMGMSPARTYSKLILTKQLSTDSNILFKAILTGTSLETGRITKYRLDADTETLDTVVNLVRPTIVSCSRAESPDFVQMNHVPTNEFRLDCVSYNVTGHHPDSQGFFE